MSTLYTEDHEWVSLEGDIATIGITNFAQTQLGDVVFVELPEVGLVLEQGDEAATVESVKSASDVYAPIDGEVVEVNENLEGEPAMVNESAEGEGWFFKLKVKDESQLDGLMGQKEYKAFIADQED